MFCTFYLQNDKSVVLFEQLSEAGSRGLVYSNL